MIKSQHVKSITIPIHILFVLSITTMIVLDDWIWLWSSVFFWTLFSGLGIAVGYHRIISHNAIAIPLWKRKVLSILGMFGCQGSPIFWVALHRGYHHNGTDTIKDFHSPIHGRWSAYMGWIFKLAPTDVNLKYAIELLRDPFQVFIHKHHDKIIWITLLAVGLMSWQIALYGFVIAMTIAQHQENLVDLYGHTPSAGYRNFELKDLSTNVPILGVFAWGQGWHNNHHKNPKSFDFGSSISGKWWEYDPCKLFKCLL
jgi:stearoyl-CoA desaturase (delta-9 desaturase)